MADISGENQPAAAAAENTPVDTAEGVTEGADEDAAVVEEEVKPFSLPILPMTLEAQRTHGLRQNDFKRYRQYCSRRLHRTRKVLKFLNGRNRYKPNTLTLEKIKDENFLHIPLLNAERAWAYAMELKQNKDTEPRAKFHSLNRLKKAKDHVQQLVDFVSHGICDARSQLEVTAYKGWIFGNVAFEAQQWDVAVTEFNEAKIIYERLSVATTGQTKAMYTQRLEEMEANLRFCAYNIKGSHGEEYMDDLLQLKSDLAKSGQLDILSSKLDDVLAQNREKEAETLKEVEWREHTIPVKGDKLRVALLDIKAKEVELEHAAKDDPELLPKYGDLFLACGDALAIVEADLQKEEAQENISQKVEINIANLRLLRAYVDSLRLTRTIERTMVMINKAKEGFPIGARGCSPDDIVRLYDILLQNISDLSETDFLRDDVSFSKTCAAKLLGYKALRCFFIAEAHRRTDKIPEALALLDRAHAHALIAKTHYAECDENIEDDVSKIDQLLLDVRAQKCKIHAQQFLKSNPEEAAAPPSTTPVYSRLDTFELTEDPTSLRLVAFPPEFKPIACKPLFWDLARNHVEFPSLAQRMPKSAVGKVTDIISSWGGGWFGGSKA